MARKLIWALTAVLSLAGTASFGQDGLLEELYGRGVHAFFSGRMNEAFDSLNTAIRNGSRDPRAFYYRALVLNRMGRPDEAKADFLQAATFEAQGGVPFSVGRALERIQGPERALLETHRRYARVAIHASQTSRDRARYEQGRRDDAEALRDAPRPTPSAMPPAGRPDSSDPFSAPPAALPPPSPAPAPIPTPSVPAPVPPPSPDPFAPPPAEAPPARPVPAEAPPATPPATPPPAPAPDPFADAPTTPPANPTPPAPAPAAPAPPANDPFATPPPTAP